MAVKYSEFEECKTINEMLALCVKNGMEIGDPQSFHIPKGAKPVGRVELEGKEFYLFFNQNTGFVTVTRMR